jgi:hypothetical protein
MEIILLIWFQKHSGFFVHFIYLFDEAVGNSGYIASSYRMIVINELERIRKEAVVTQVWVLTLRRWLNQEKAQSGSVVRKRGLPVETVTQDLPKTKKNCHLLRSEVQFAHFCHIEISGSIFIKNSNGVDDE